MLKNDINDKILLLVISRNPLELTLYYNKTKKNKKIERIKIKSHKYSGIWEITLAKHLAIFKATGFKQCIS